MSSDARLVVHAPLGAQLLTALIAACFLLVTFAVVRGLAVQEGPGAGIAIGFAALAAAGAATGVTVAWAMVRRPLIIASAAELTYRTLLFRPRTLRWSDVISIRKIVGSDEEGNRSETIEIATTDGGRHRIAGFLVQARGRSVDDIIRDLEACRAARERAW